MTKSQPIPSCELEFLLVEDRYAHLISIRQGDVVAPLLRSVEGQQGDQPLSPPLQQIHQQELPTGPVIWGLGMSGTVHWSASFAVLNEQKSGGHRRLHVEFAARFQSVPRNCDQEKDANDMADKGEVECGIRYAISDLSDLTIQQTDQSQLEIHLPNSCVRIIGNIENCRIVWDGRSREFNIGPIRPVGVGGETIRWDYFVETCPTR